MRRDTIATQAMNNPPKVTRQQKTTDYLVPLLASYRFSDTTSFVGFVSSLHHTVTSRAIAPPRFNRPPQQQSAFPRVTVQYEEPSTDPMDEGFE